MDLSINLTIHNKENIIKDVLHRIQKHTTGAYELIIVLDGCTDGTEEIVNDFLYEYPKQECSIIYAENVFETKANNMAAKASHGKHIIIVQDDVLINEDGWNLRLLKPFKEFGDVFAVTGNTAHNWAVNPDSVDVKTDINHNDRWSDILTHIHHANQSNMPRDIFAVRDCVNRAPLAIDHVDLEKMHYFDEEFAPQDMDDHDLCYRMHKKLGKQVGSYWIDWFSKPEYGGTRDGNGQAKPWLLEAQNKNTRIVYNRHKDYISTQTIQNRILK